MTKSNLKCLHCGSKKNIERHHNDYSKLHEVIIFCRKCHRRWHRENQAIGSNYRIAPDMDKNLFEQLRRYAFKVKTSKSEIARRAIRKFLEEEKNIKN